MKKKICLILIYVVLLTGCSQKKELKQVNILEETEEIENLVEDRVATIPVKQVSELSVWVAYWDMESVVSELEVLGEQLTGLSYFEAYLNSEYHVVLPEGYLETCKELKTNAHFYI